MLNTPEQFQQPMQQQGLRGEFQPMQQQRGWGLALNNLLRSGMNPMSFGGLGMMGGGFGGGGGGVNPYGVGGNFLADLLFGNRYNPQVQRRPRQTQDTLQDF